LRTPLFSCLEIKNFKDEGFIPLLLVFSFNKFTTTQRLTTSQQNTIDSLKLEQIIFGASGIAGGQN